MKRRKKKLVLPIVVPIEEWKRKKQNSRDQNELFEILIIEYIYIEQKEYI